MIDTLARWLDPPLHILFWLPAKILHKEICSACTLAVRLRQGLLFFTRPLRRVAWIDHHRIDWEQELLVRAVAHETRYYGAFYLESTFNRILDEIDLGDYRFAWKLEEHDDERPAG